MLFFLVAFCSMLSDHTLHVVCHEGSYTKPVFAGVLSLIFILYTHVHWMTFKVDRKAMVPHACNSLIMIKVAEW